MKVVISRLKHWVPLIIVLVILAFALNNCVYYNTFYNARKAFNEAEKARKGTKRSRRSGGAGGYKKAIEKSLKVIEDYPNSKYYDDALYVLTVSYYHTKQHSRSERRAREILANHPDSKYAHEAKLYLAKAKLELRDIANAMDIFQEIFEGDFARDFKVEAALALTTYYIDNRHYADAEPYLLALRDSLGTDEDRKLAQHYLADGYFERFHHQEALGAYLQLLGMDPDMEDKYVALFRAAVCSYRLQRIDEAQDYLRTLIDDELYFDSLGVLKLKLAEGYEYDEDLAQAEETYNEILEVEQNRKVRAEAFWNLGLMYQYDYDDLTQAKEYYDSTTQLSRGSEIGGEALQKSSDIGKRESYKLQVETIDSTATQDIIDETAYTQYQLAELYWFQLYKPDTAILEMKYVADSFPTAYDAPKAMIALSEMVRKHEKDSVKADSILRQVLLDYPASDYVPQALELLGLKGTPADTGYAGVYFNRAESFLVDEETPDSARSYYQIVVDRFPDSKYYLQSRFALIWLTEMYDSPGDSSVILAYNELVDSFPDTEWATLARKRTQYAPAPTVPDDAEADTMPAVQYEQPGFLPEGEEDTASTYVDPLEAVYIDPDGEKIMNHPYGPIRVEEEFIYPTEAYRLAWEGDLYFQIFLDFSGEVEDYVFMIKSPSEEINRRAEATVASMTFDPSRIPEPIQGNWMVYKFRVTLPDHLR